MQSAAHNDNLCSAPIAGARPTTAIKIGRALSEEDELCAFLRDKARVSSSIMKKTLDSLHDENVFQVEDLVHLRKVNGLDRVLKPVTASKVIEALDALAALKLDAEGSPQTTMRKQPPPVAALAVCLSGWLNVSIPAAGQLTRQYLVDPLKADVFVAGTYRAESDCAACLRERLRGLQPIRGLDVATMLTRDELASMMNSSPHFGAVKSAFDVSKTYNGLSIFSPLLGSGASVLREYHDYSRVTGGARGAFDRLQLHVAHLQPTGARLARATSATGAAGSRTFVDAVAGRPRWHGSARDNGEALWQYLLSSVRAAHVRSLVRRAAAEVSLLRGPRGSA